MRKLLLLLTVLYTILLITRPQEFVPNLADSPILQTVLLCALGIWVFTKDKALDLPQFKIIPIFLLTVWLSLGFAHWWGGIGDALGKMLPPILTFVIVTACVRSRRELSAYSTVIILCAAVLVLHGHLQKTIGYGWTGQPLLDGRITYTGIFNDPNDMGLLIVLAIGLCCHELRARKSRFLRLITLVAIGWLLYGVYLTDSRGTMLATLAVMGLQLWDAYGKTLVIVLGAITIPAVAAVTRLSQVDADEESAEGRVDAWYEGLQMLVDHPVFGVGWGMFGDHNLLTAHNSIVLAMAELGLIGYTAWLAFVIATGWMIFRCAYPARIITPLPAAVGLPVAGATTTVAKVPVDFAKEQLAARGIFFAVIGFAIGAFFLSQSYKAMIFLNAGLATGRYLGMRELGLMVPKLLLSQMFPRIVVIVFGTVVAMYVLVRVLL